MDLVFDSKFFEAIKNGNNRLVQDQMNMVGRVEQTNQILKIFLIFLLYAALHCYGKQDFSYWVAYFTIKFLWACCSFWAYSHDPNTCKTLLFSLLPWSSAFVVSCEVLALLIHGLLHWTLSFSQFINCHVWLLFRTIYLWLQQDPKNRNYLCFNLLAHK